MKSGCCYMSLHAIACQPKSSQLRHYGKCLVVRAAVQDATVWSNSHVQEMSDVVMQLSAAGLASSARVSADSGCMHTHICFI
jgi:hypothetical protein